MQSSLFELLENLRCGLLWVQRSGVVRYANRDAQQCTGLSAGQTLTDVRLKRVVLDALERRMPVVSSWLAQTADAGSLRAQLPCRILPGLGPDDVFVLTENTQNQLPRQAFDSLADLIQSDLAQPLAQVQAELLRTNTSDASADALQARWLPVLQALAQAVGEVLSLTRLWQNGALAADDRIELGQLLQEVWSELAPLADERRQQVRFLAFGMSDNQTALYGSRELLHSILSECLETALRNARPGAMIDVEHNQLGPRALLVLRDCGGFEPVGRDVMPLGPVSGISRRTARDALGRKLCQHILALHGGQLREEEEGGVHQLLIELPTGAPGREAPNGLGVAQAQKYARDLAALMAQGRTRAARAA